MSDAWRAWRERIDPAEYHARFAALDAPHGEADLVMSHRPATVLDAGCGTGRVAIELARRGVEVVGVDLDPDMVAVARREAPELAWVVADLATFDLGRRFDLIVMAGNVPVFMEPSSLPPALVRLGAHLVDGGTLLAGFQCATDLLERYDDAATAAGLELVDRWSTWDRDRFEPGGAYAVSAHRAQRNSGSVG